MKRRVLLYGLLLVFCCLFAIPAVEAKAADYLITQYNVDMKVTKQNTYRIQETITTNFLQARHGIYRDIPVKNDVKRTDGSTDRIVAQVENISCGGDQYEVSREGDNCRIQIGDEDETVIGEKVYNISYDYVMGNDVLPDEDELYFNIIGNEWQSSIQNVTFRIEMPAEFEEEKLGMSYGPAGSTETSGLYYYLEGNTIYGELDSDILLSPYEGVNVRLSLPEGYFERTEKTPYLAYAAIVLAVITVGLAFLLWWLFGRDDPVVETVEFYPPAGLNSVELAFVYNGHSSPKDVISLIVYLAQKGYIEIREAEGKKAGKDFTLIRKRPYDGVNELEQIFMDGLFAKGEIVTKKDLENSFYKTVNRITAKMESKQNKEKIFYANSLNKGWILWLLSLVTCLLAGFVPVKNYEYSLLAGILIPLGVGIMPMISSLIFFSQGNLAGRVICGLAFLVPGGVGYGFFLREPLQYDNIWYQIAFFAAAAAGFIAMFFHSYLSKRTPYGTEMLGKIRGFRTFLETAEKERLEALVMENPQYFYEILPYTYVLKISDKWMKKFESITVEPPTWYAGSYSSFDMIMFHHFMNTTMSAATSSMTSTPSSSSSSGGGFSGGGSGGGGGGSW